MPDVMPVVVMPVVMRRRECSIDTYKHQAHGDHRCANLLHTIPLAYVKNLADYRTSRAR
jgi:hypothetical protein